MLESYLSYIQEQENNNYKIGKSDIHGNGVMAVYRIPQDQFINAAILPTGPSYQATNFGSYLNHCPNPNAETRFEKGRYDTYSIKEIKAGDEITVDYTKNPELEQPQTGWK